MGEGRTRSQSLRVGGGAGALQCLSRPGLGGGAGSLSGVSPPGLPVCDPLLPTAALWATSFTIPRPCWALPASRLGLLTPERPQVSSPEGIHPILHFEHLPACVQEAAPGRWGPGCKAHGQNRPSLVPWPKNGPQRWQRADEARGSSGAEDLRAGPWAGHQEKELRAPPSVKLWVTGTGVGSRASLFWSQEEDDLNRAGQLSPDPSQPHD